MSTNTYTDARDRTGDEPPTGGNDEGGDEGDAIDAASLQARLAVLEEENERLRREYRRARQARYRRTALGLAGVGAVSITGAVAFPAVRDVLLVLGAIGVFAGVVTFYLTPERVVTASVAEHVYSAVAANGEALVDELALREERVYVPTDDDVRLFVPQHAEYLVPEALASLFVVPDNERERGIAVTPTGVDLLADFRDALTGGLADDPATLVAQIADGVVEQFELVDAAETDVDVDGSQATVRVSGSTLGDVSRFDHPTVSFVAATLADGLDEPVRASVRVIDDNDALVTCEWDIRNVQDAETNASP